jgi:hypothetical protein
VGKLVKIDGIMDSEKYCEILEDNLEKSVPHHISQYWIFQQDNDSKHTSKHTTKFLRKKSIKLLEWPSQSPDLNPIENLWAILDSLSKDRGCMSEEELLSTLQDDAKIFLKKLSKA